MLSKVKATVLTLDMAERFEEAANSKDYDEIFELLTNPDYRDLFMAYLSKREDGASLIEDALSYKMSPETVFPVLLSIAEYFGDFQRFKKLVESITETVLPKMTSWHVVSFLLGHGKEILDILRQNDLLFEGVLDKVTDYFEQIKGKIETEELGKKEREEVREQLRTIVDLVKDIGKPLPPKFTSIVNYFLIEIPESLYSKPEPEEDIALLARECSDFLSELASLVPKYQQKLYQIASNFAILVGKSKGEIEKHVLKGEFDNIVKNVNSIIKKIVVDMLLRYLCDAFLAKDIPSQYPKPDPGNYTTVFSSTHSYLSEITDVNCSFDEEDQNPINITIVLRDMLYTESFSSKTVDSFLYWLIEVATSFRRKLPSEIRENIHHDYYEYLKKTAPDLVQQGIPLVDLGGYQEMVGITSATRMYKDVKDRIMYLLEKGVHPSEMSFYDLQLTLSPSVLFTIVNWLEKDRDVIQAISTVGGDVRKLRELIISDYKNYFKETFKKE